MAVANLKTNLLDTLKSDIEVSDVVNGERIFLTPYLALACGLLYMMASDGELEAEESSQLQAVLGGDDAVLSYALRYVQSVPVEQFFATASELLSVKDKWCILTNVCDALLSDGHADPAELTLFAQMVEAFGVRNAQFEPYFKILALKNDKSVLGRYAGVKEERQPMTPHFALAIALLYMLTSDGSIGKHEIGQLEAVIGEFDGLQNVALKYVRSVKLKQFLDEAAALLRPEQKIYILTNVCDSMLSDGEVAHLEDKLFLSMLTAFGFTEKTFARYLQVLETKNVKPFDTNAFKNRVTHERMTGMEDAEGVTFKNEFNDLQGEALSVLPDAANQGVWVGATGDAEMENFITRTMENNIQNMSDDFDGQDNVVKVALNATDGLNLQKVGDGDGAANNRQRLEGADTDDNLQKIDASGQGVNRQEIESTSALANRQSIGSQGVGDNLQTIDADVHDSHRETVPPEVRVQNIHEVAEEVNHRLDRFEAAHSRFLQIGRAQKFTDDFALVENELSDTNRQLLDASYTRMGLAFSVDQVSIKLVSDVVMGGGAEVEGLTEVQEVNDSVLIPMMAVPQVAAASKDDELNAHSRQKRLVTKDRGVAGLAFYRGRGFVYVQLVVATFAIVFAPSIATRSALGRSVTGPLISAPIFMPELNEQRNAADSEGASAKVMMQ
jgi:uncharacterized tellurite resistance protein B-like protein